MNDNDFCVFQSDSMDELVKERQKNKALQNLLHVNDAHTKYYYIENGPNGNYAKHSIDTNYLDAIAKTNNVYVDGYIGEQTNKAVNSVDEKWLIKEIQKARAEHCDNIVDKHPNQRVFIQGWFNRINDIGRKCGCDTICESRHLK